MLRELVLCLFSCLSLSINTLAFTTANQQHGVIKEAMERFYAKHNPDKVHLVERALQQFRGRESELIAKLEKKYDDRLDLAAASEATTHKLFREQNAEADGGQAAVDLFIKGVDSLRKRAALAAFVSFSQIIRKENWNDHTFVAALVNRAFILSHTGTASAVAEALEDLLLAKQYATANGGNSSVMVSNLLALQAINTTVHGHVEDEGTMVANAGMFALEFRCAEEHQTHECVYVQQHFDMTNSADLRVLKAAVKENARQNLQPIDFACRSDQMCVQMDGEPRPRLSPSLFDVNLLVVRSSNFRRSFFLPTLSYNLLHEIYNPEATGSPAINRPIDVLYRSSNCAPRREALASSIRVALDAEGLNFTYTGKCKAGANGPNRGSLGPDNRAMIEQVNVWESCPECAQAKMMIAFENYDVLSEDEYLSEKPFLPLVYGALPLYEGSGQLLMREMGINPKKMLDRAVFESDGDFVREIVRLAKSPLEIDRVQTAEDVFLKGHSPDFDLSEIRKYTCTLPLSKKTMPVKIFMSMDNHFKKGRERISDWLKDALCFVSAAHVQEAAEADVVLTGARDILLMGLQ
jgi:hypothetical protein